MAVSSLKRRSSSTSRRAVFMNRSDRDSDHNYGLGMFRINSRQHCATQTVQNVHGSETDTSMVFSAATTNSDDRTDKWIFRIMEVVPVHSTMALREQDHQQGKLTAEWLDFFSLPSVPERVSSQKVYWQPTIMHWFKLNAVSRLQG